MKKTTSPYIIVKESRIHNKGVFAKTNVPKGAQVIEYVGEKLTKAKAHIRADIPLEKNEKNSYHGAVYLFELNKRYDIDGYVAYNTARFINHSCNPNCESEIVRGRIWIIALRDIKKGDEITYNYGYGLDDYEEHRCRCKADNCIGYILAEEHWPKLKKRKTKKRK